MTQVPTRPFAPGLFRKQLEELDERQPGEEFDTYADQLSNRIVERRESRVVSPYAKRLIDRVSRNQEEVEDFAELLSGGGDQRDTLQRKGLIRSVAILNFMERFGLFTVPTFEGFLGEFEKGALRGTANLMALPTETQAAVARMFRNQVIKPLAEKAGFTEEMMAAIGPTRIENLAAFMRKQINEASEAIIAPKPQDRIFAWDDPDWWAGQAGESLAFLVATLGVGAAAGAAAKGLQLAPKLVTAIRIGAAASTSGLLEANLARADFVTALEERGFTNEEALQLADTEAVGVGIINGILDIVPLQRFLGRGKSRHLVFNAFLTMATEAVTESAQEIPIIFAERRLGIAQPGTEKERLLASFAVGAVVAGGPSVVTSFGQRGQAAKERRVDGDVVTELPADTEADVAKSRKEILGRGPLTKDERDFVEVSRDETTSELRDDTQAFNEEERAIARENAEDILDSGLNPFTNEPLTDDQRAGVMEMLDEINNVQEVLEEEPDESFTNIEEPTDAITREEVEQVTPEAEGQPPVTQEERQEAEETEREQVDEIEKDAEEQPEPVAGEQELPVTPPVSEHEPFPDTLSAVGQAFPEIGERVSRVQALNQQIDELLAEEVGPARVDQLVSELEAAQAEVSDAIAEAKVKHGQAGGRFDTANRGARAAGPSAEASVERMVDTVRTRAGGEEADARTVAVDSDTPQGQIISAARQIGLRVVYFENTGEADVPAAHDPYGDGRTILLDVTMPVDAQLKAIFSHELVHAIQQASLTVWEKFFNRITVLDPTGLRKAARAYWDGMTKGTVTTEADFEAWVNSVQGRNESVARYVEDHAEDTSFYERVIGRDRNLLTFIRDLARRLANIFGLMGLDQKILIQIEKLADEGRKAFEKAPEPSALEVGQIVTAVNLAVRQPQGRGVRLRAERVTGVKRDVTTEKEMRLLRRVFREQKKVGEQAFRAGLSAAQGRVLNVLEGIFGKMGMAVTQKQIEAMQRARKARSPAQVLREGIKLMDAKVRLVRLQLLEDARAGRVSVKAMQRQVVDAVKTLLTGPQGVKMQGRFLGDVERATTPTQLHKALMRIQLAVGQASFEGAVSDLKKVQKKARTFAHNTNELREQTGIIINQAFAGASVISEEGKPGRTRQFDTREEYDQAREAVLDAVDAVEALLAIREAERNTFDADQARTVEGHVNQVLANMGRIKTLTGRDKMVQDKTTKWIEKGLIAIMDVANLSRHAEGVDEGVLPSLLDRVQKEAEEEYNSDRRDEADDLNSMVKENTGYLNLAEAQMKMQGTLGEANQDFRDVTIGGETVPLSLDVIGELVAIDERTLAGVVENGLQVEGARQTEPLRPTLSEMQAIRQKWAPRFGNLVVAMKGKIEVLKPRTFAVAKLLKGREPTAEPPGYWPSTRNLSAAPEFGLSADLRSFMQSAAKRWLENAGFLQERTGGDSPFVMRGLLRTYMDHTDQSLKIIHLAVPVRNAAAVLLNPQVVREINRTHGSSMNTILQKHLIEASRLNQDTDGGPDRVLRALNSNMVGTFLATNIGTFIRQIGGVFRIWSKLPPSVFFAGLQALKAGTYAEMKKGSGFFWDRYEGDSAARYSPMRGQGLEGMDFSSFQQSFGAMMRAVRKRDLKSAGRSWNSAMRSLKMLDWFDAIPARIAWEGRKAQIRAENPTWTDTQVLKETSLRASDDIRSTQNTSSPNDSAGLAVNSRNSLLRYMLLFTTDPNKSLNFMIRSWRTSPSAGIKSSIGVAGNVLWSSYVVTMGLQYTGDLVAGMLAAALGREPDEQEREKQRLRSWEKSHARAVSEVLGLAFFGDELVNLVEATSQPFRRDSVFRAPIMETFTDTAFGGAEVGVSIWKRMNLMGDELTDKEKDKFTEGMIDGTVDAAKGGSTLIGNPFLMPWYRARPIIRQVFPSEEDEKTSRELSPEVR